MGKYVPRTPLAESQMLKEPPLKNKLPSAADQYFRFGLISSDPLLFPCRSESLGFYVGCWLILPWRHFSPDSKRVNPSSMVSGSSELKTQRNLLFWRAISLICHHLLPYVVDLGVYDPQGSSEVWTSRICCEIFSRPRTTFSLSQPHRDSRVQFEASRTVHVWFEPPCVVDDFQQLFALIGWSNTWKQSY